MKRMECIGFVFSIILLCANLETIAVSPPKIGSADIKPAKTATMLVNWQGEGAIEVIINQKNFTFNKKESRQVPVQPGTQSMIKVKYGNGPENLYCSDYITYSSDTQYLDIALVDDEIELVFETEKDRNARLAELQRMEDMATNRKKEIDLLFLENMKLVESNNANQDPEDENYQEQNPSEIVYNDFYLGAYEVTQSEWYLVMGTNPSYKTGCDSCPVENVSYFDVLEFIKKLNAITGNKYRLPTEAEWEFAAKGGAGSIGYKYSGSDDLNMVGWYNENSGGTTHPVGQKMPNELGVYDMSGNVWEWCSEPINQTPGIGQSNSPLLRRVFRGGSWGHNATYATVTYRCDFNPVIRYSSLGFRLALDAE
jgi:formylglycine-generating enzyme required for sulfatase activity